MPRTVLDKQIRRQQILDASIKVLSRKGYRSASISDMVFEAGVARGTFYLYFDSKAEIFKSALDYYMEGIKNLVMRGMRTRYGAYGARESLKAALTAWLRFFDEHRELSRVVLRDAVSIDPDYDFKYAEVSSAVTDHWRGVMEELRKAGLLREEIEPGFAGSSLVSMLERTALDRILPEQRPDIAGLASGLLDFLENGLLSIKPQDTGEPT
ncbi:MAG: TetR/AcrR family transcriptional regulator [bacterium]